MLAPRRAASRTCCCGAGLRACMPWTSAMASCTTSCEMIHGSCSWSAPTFGFSKRLPEQPDLAVADLSFISLRLALPAVFRLLKTGGGDHCAGQAAVRGRPSGRWQRRRSARSAGSSTGVERTRQWSIGSAVAARRLDRIAHQGSSRQHGIPQPLAAPVIISAGCSSSSRSATSPRSSTCTSSGGLG